MFPVYTTRRRPTSRAAAALTAAKATFPFMLPIQEKSGASEYKDFLSARKKAGDKNHCETGTTKTSGLAFVRKEKYWRGQMFVLTSIKRTNPRIVSWALIGPSDLLTNHSSALTNYDQTNKKRQGGEKSA